MKTLLQSKTRQLMGFALLPLAALSQLNAKITVDDTASWKSGNANLGGTFDASASDKLVFIVTGEHGFNQTANGVIGNVFYDGVQLTPLVTRNPIKASAEPPILVDDTYNAIFYLDNPGAVHVGGVITTTDFQSRGNVGVIALSGTAVGAGNTVIGNRDTNTASLTTSAGSIVIASYGLGGSGNTAQLAPVTTPDWDAEIARQINGNNWDGHVVAYQNNVAAGTASYTFIDTTTPAVDGRTGRHVIAAEFLSAPPAATFQLIITPNGANFDFSWDSQPGKVYDLVTSTDLATPILTWPVYDPDGPGGSEPFAGIPATGATTTLTAVLGDGPRRFFAMIERDAPPLFSEDFEADDGGFSATGTPNDWAWGIPNSDNSATPSLILNTGNGGSTKCWGTNLGMGGTPSGTINTAANSILRSPDINLTGITGASLHFAAALDASASDTVQVLVREVGTDALLDTLTPFTLPVTTNWASVGPLPLTAADNKNIYLEFRYQGADAAYIGLYIDDVTVTQ